MINKCVSGTFTIVFYLAHVSTYSGWYDPLLQNQAYVDFATFAPGYGQLVSDTVVAQLNEAFFGANGCKEQEEACYAASPGNVSTPTSNAICRTADNFCVSFGILGWQSVLMSISALGRQCVRPSCW